MFDERKALQMTLESLLEERAALRRNYVDQDKALGLEIKQVLLRIRELDERDGQAGTVVREEQSSGKASAGGDEPRYVPQRKRYIRHDFQALARQVEEILAESKEPLSLAELCTALHTRFGVELASPYISIRKSLEHSHRVKVEKDGKKLRFFLE